MTAQHLELGPHHAMMRGACLRGAGGRVLLRARKICWDRGELRAKGAKVALCPCGPREPLFHLGASRIWRYRGSQRLHLLWPTLHLGPV
ncbi:MAG: hypothetical protein KAI47_08265, partial [Deltaproteobacteria bacterium]|nr:hypothetical protein [Deltaproteobacteria bacterium]